VPESAGITLE